MRNVVLLGSTGSIGTSTVKVAEDLPGDIRLVGLAAHPSEPPATRGAEIWHGIVDPAPRFPPSKLSGLT